MDFEFLIPLATASVTATVSYLRSRKAKAEVEAIDEATSQQLEAIEELASEASVPDGDEPSVEVAPVESPRVAPESVDDTVTTADQLTVELVRGHSLDDIRAAVREIVSESEARQRAAQRRTNWAAAGWAALGIAITIAVTWYFTANADQY